MKVQKKRWMRVLIAFAFATIGYFVRKYNFEPPLSEEFNFALYLVSFVFINLIWTFFANINVQLERVLPFRKNAALRIAMQLIIGTAVIVVIRFGMNAAFNNVLQEHIPFHLRLTNELRILLVITDVFLALTINLAVISNYIIQRWKEDITRAESLERKKAQMQYHHLRNQVNPHFLFNSFSSLQSLIRSNPELAANYVGQLAKVYRYVMKHKENVIVSLQTELDFIEHYMHLLKIRYGMGIDFRIELDELAREKGIVNVTLQMLIDNALKHNEVHPDRPLTISISANDTTLCVANNFQPRQSLVESNGEGLLQLKNLYAYHSEMPVTFSVEKEEYRVKMPLL